MGFSSSYLSSKKAIRIEFLILLVAISSIRLFNLDYILQPHKFGLTETFSGSDTNCTSTSSSSTSNDALEEVKLQTLMIPEQPDATPTLKILDVMTMEPANANNITKLTGTHKDISIQNNTNQHCSPTSQVRLITTTLKNVRKWTMQSLDQNGKEKTVGGDEFYITFHSDLYYYHNEKAPDMNADHPLAVGKVEDMGDGTYDIDFISTPMAMEIESKSPLPSEGISTMGGGNVTVHFVFSCGIGQMAPPSKNEWKNGGFTQTSYTVRVDSPPPIRRFQRPKRVVDFEEFDHTVFVGDSIMKQFVGTKGTLYHSRISLSHKQKGRPLGSNTLKSFVNQACQAVQKQVNKYSKVALVLGSSTWDILADDIGQGALFLDHRSAMWKLLETMKTRYPNVKLIWLSPTALHAHVVIDKSTPMFG